MSKLNACPPRPRRQRSLPTYPRALLAAGLALNVAGCMGVAPDAYHPAAPTSQVVVQPAPSPSYAQPPPEKKVPSPPPVKEPDPDVPLAGVAPAPFEP